MAHQVKDTHCVQEGIVEGATAGKEQLFAKADFSNGEAEHKAQVMPYSSRGATRCLSHSMGLGAVPQGTLKTRQGEKS